MNNNILNEIKELIANNQKFIIMQADNPDGDSLGSALALEHILADLGKEPFLYCGVDLPKYLYYMDGADRVSKEMPTKFDVTIIVDTSAWSLFEKLSNSSEKMWVFNKPCLVIDHHKTPSTIPFPSITCNEQVVSTTELIFKIAMKLKWKVSPPAANLLAAGLMSDSLGLTSEALSSDSLYALADLVKLGANIATIENKRRELGRKSPKILYYKSQLLQRIEYFFDNKIATVTIPFSEIELYSQEYNPAILVLDELRNVQNVEVAIVFKQYPQGKITAKIRTNLGVGIAASLAEHFGGGGHSYASGFKITDGKPFDDVKKQCIEICKKLLDKKDENI